MSCCVLGVLLCALSVVMKQLLGCCSQSGTVIGFPLSWLVIAVRFLCLWRFKLRHVRFLSGAAQSSSSADVSASFFDPAAPQLDSSASAAASVSSSAGAIGLLSLCFVLFYTRSHTHAGGALIATPGQRLPSRHAQSHQPMEVDQSSSKPLLTVL